MSCPGGQCNKMAQLRQIFYSIDTNRSGFIEKNELIAVMRRVGYSDADINVIFSRADFDGDGRINFNEFCQSFTV